MSKHTPGPWLVRDDVQWPAEVKDKIVGPKYGEQVALVYRDSDQDLANAHLIAAAPDMLEALQEFVDTTDHIPDHLLDLWVKASGLVAKIELASIAKAKGGSDE
jgi:hypothetical protein